MANGKLDEQLELAMQVPKEVLVNDIELSTGYIYDENKWELIIKYSGDIKDDLDNLGALIEPHIYRSITIAHKSRKKRYPTLSSCPKILCP